jgi:4-hydroxy-3-polyprenylbenzoate decarboxylase
MYRSLRDFLRALDDAGELLRVGGRVSPILEISAIAARHARRPAPSACAAARTFDPARAGLGGMALFFEDVDGCDFPVAINVFGSYRRTEMALGCADSGGFPAIAARLGPIAKPQPPRSLRELAAKGRQLLPLLRTPPRLVRAGACQQVVRRSDRGEVDLRRLPLLKCWPLDGNPRAVGYPLSAEDAGTAAGEGRYVTFAGMHTIHADDRPRGGRRPAARAGAARPASHNIGMYRAQLVDATRLVMHWHVHHDGAAHWRSWKACGERMPIAICFGGESVLPYAATAPLPPGLSELLMAGFLNGHGIPLVRAKTVPLRVPANSEIVIEGWVSTECGAIGWDPRDGSAGQLGPGAAFEGPFGDHTGYYSLPDRYPLVEVSAVTHRRDAIFPATIVGPPPQEDYYLGKATERIFLPLLQTLIPDIDDYHLPRFGCFHNCAFVRIRKAYPLQARRVMHAVWGAGQMAWTKVIVVVDEDVDVHDEEAVLAALFERCHFGRDVEIVNGPLDILDHAAPRLGAGHKIGFDATPKRPGEEVNGVSAGADASPGAQRLDADLMRRVIEPLAGRGAIREVHVPGFGRGRCVFVRIEKTAPRQGLDAVESVWRTARAGADLVVVVSADVDLVDWERVLFHLCANMDPGRDLARESGGAARGRLAFDATAKMPGDERNGQPVREWPPYLTPSPDVEGRIDERAAELGLS